MRDQPASQVTEIDQTQEPKTLVEAAYLRMRRDIIEGIYAPGEKLRVEHLKDQYEVGAGTLREALLLLVTDALVVAQGQRGFRVAPISIADCEDISHTRVLLETEALRQSIARGDDAWEAALVAAFHRLTRAEQKLCDNDDSTTEEWEKCNRAFHEALISASTSRWIRHFQQILYQQSERYRRVSLFRQPITRDIHAEHHALFDATLARDAARASSILSEHILRTLDAVKRLPVDFFSQRA
ncbi:MAG: FCD domain-containing protein [Proteobacteria bacterium]|nr:FCD domain-containing protein [Pseudomonadota bacterium]